MLQGFIGADIGAKGRKKEFERMENIKKEQKQRVVAWLHPEMIEKIELVMQSDNMKNHTEFVAKAVDFYIGYLCTEESTTFLSDTLVGAVQGTIQNTENRIANNLFRLSVEMAMMMNLIAAGLEIDDDQLVKLRGRCVREIKKTKGRVTLEDAVAYQREY